MMATQLQEKSVDKKEDEVGIKKSDMNGKKVLVVPDDSFMFSF